jgi:hypothetical protein
VALPACKLFDVPVPFAAAAMFDDAVADRANTWDVLVALAAAIRLTELVWPLGGDA